MKTYYVKFGNDSAAAVKADATPVLTYTQGNPAFLEFRIQDRVVAQFNWPSVTGWFEA